MTSVVADSHAILWYVQGSDRLSEQASAALASAEADGGIVVSVATLVDLWYVTQTTERVTADDLARLRGGACRDALVALSNDSRSSHKGLPSLADSEDLL